MFHQKKHHPDLPYLYSPSEINCSRCLQTIQISGILIHNTVCDKRSSKKRLKTIVEEIGLNESRVRCMHCKRKFAVDRIIKHQQACEVSSKKRPQFEIEKKRLPHLYDTYEKINSKRGSLNLIYPNSKWQKQHLDLMKNLRLEEDENYYIDYTPCPYCFRRFAPFSAEKHIDICKKILNKPKPPPSMTTNRFPNIQPERKISIRANSLNSLRSSSVLNRSSQLLEKNDKNLSGSANEDLAVAENPHFNLPISPIKTPILKSDLLDPNYTHSIRKDLPEAICPVCMKKVVASNLEKHITTCRNKILKPSYTVKELAKEEGKSRYIKLPKKHAFVSQQRSLSTQRIVCSGVCQSCRAIFPKPAKFCMMCGSIRV